MKRYKNPYENLAQSVIKFAVTDFFDGELRSSWFDTERCEFLCDMGGISYQLLNESLDIELEKKADDCYEAYDLEQRFWSMEYFDSVKKRKRNEKETKKKRKILKNFRNFRNFRNFSIVIDNEEYGAGCMKIINGVHIARDPNGNVLETYDFRRAYLWARGYGNDWDSAIRYWADALKRR